MKKSAGNAVRGVNTGVTMAPVTARTVTARVQISRCVGVVARVCVFKF